MSSVTQKRSWFLVFLYATVAVGLVLRWQFAGHFTDVAFLDWRRAHSHLGFYGVLFPLSWICLQATAKAWTPTARMFLFYALFVAGAGIAFLFQGYAFASIFFSTGVLAVWLIFAWKNFRASGIFQRDWSVSISVSIFISALLIFTVAFLNRSHPELSQKVARAFLTFLLFGVFTPSVLRFLKAPAPAALLWLAATGATSVYLTKIADHFLFGFGAALLGVLLLQSILRSSLQDFRLKGAWSLFALSLILTGSNLVPYTYYRAIAGIHFVVLGPLLMSFALCRLQLKIPWVLRSGYELCLGGMVISIALQDLVPVPLQNWIAGLSSAMVLCLILVPLSLVNFSVDSSLPKKRNESPAQN